jgi:hypothetical protein
VAAEFDTSVFINCPFDEAYKPLLQALAFCCVSFGFAPRLASENMDSASIRLGRITALIKECRYSVHDLSRSQASKKGEFARMNMPFELGVDYGCRAYSEHPLNQKRILILDEKRYRYQAALSDLAGCDPEAHDGDYEKLITVVRNWLVNEAGAAPQAASAVVYAYQDFQEWNWERLLLDGYEEDDIKSRPTIELIREMQQWVDAGRPPSFN